MSERSYVVGLPVVVTVTDTGDVTYEIDTSEASSEMSENFDQVDDHPTEEEMLLDSAVVDGWNSTPHPVRVTLVAASGVPPMRCPVRYSCEFRTSDLHEMASHIDDFDHSDAPRF